MPSLPSPRARTRPRLEIIPFIDIMFFLLATFMMVSLSMSKTEGLPVSLPSASTGGQEDRKASVTVTVTENGDVFLDKERISVGSVKPRLSALAAKNPDLKVFVNADEKADFGKGVQILDEVRSIGIKKVYINTTRKK